MKVGLQTRLLTSLIFLVVSTLSIMGYVLLEDAERRINHQQLTQAQYQAKTLAKGSLDALVTRDYELLERWVASSLPSEEYAYAALVRPDGTTLTHTNLVNVGHKTSTETGLKDSFIKNTYYNKRPVTEIIHPAYVGTKHIANAHIAFYLDMDRGVADESIPWIITALLLTLLVLIIGSFAISRKIINPINYLTRTVASASLDKHIALEKNIVDRNDEVGSLARTFSSMSDRLIGAYLQIKQKSIELEDRVNERTQALSESNKYLQESESRIASIMENVHDGVITFNAEGVIESYNNSAEKLFCFTKLEAIGNKINILVPKECSDQDKNIFDNIQALKERFVDGCAQEIIAQCKNGTLFPLEISLSEQELGEQVFYIATMRDITDRKAMVENLRYAADHDELTGLYNRSYFLQELERVVSRTHRDQNQTCAVFYIDLDNFKYVNDTMGHAAGDQVLIEITNIMMKRLRKSDLSARLGGDEFAVLIYDTNVKMAEEIANSFRQCMEDYRFTQSDETADVGCSIGIAMITKECSSAKDVVAHADYACYQAKRAGRNRVRLFYHEDKNDIDMMSLDMGWSRRIKNAIEEDSFVLAYQPIVNIATQETDCYEVLIRMQDTNGELILPGGFLPAAERLGLSEMIDEWVIGKAINTLAELRNTNNNLRFSINLSPPSLTSGKVCELIEQTLVTTGLDPSALTFELTESMAISNLTAASACLHRIKDIGCFTSLDDFGSGFSSFPYLKELPIDIVKIDGRYVKNLVSDKVNQAMVKSISDITSAMGKQTVAEFVEDEGALKLLAEFGIDYGQGFYLGRPETKINFTTTPQVKNIIAKVRES